MDSKPLSVGNMPMNFKLTLEERVRAAAGVPAYMRRKRRIEDLEQALRQALDEVYQDVLAETGDEQAAKSERLTQAKAMDLRLLNDLIERHNKYYPIEANLPVDVKTGKFLMMGKPWVPEALLTWRDFA